METTKPSRRSSSATIHRSPQQKRATSIESAVSLPEPRSFTSTRSPSPQQQQPQQQPHVNIRRISRSTTSSPRPSTTLSPRPSVDRSTSALRLRTTYVRENSRVDQPMKKLLPSSINNSPKTPIRISNASISSDDINAASTRRDTRKASPQKMRSSSSMRRSTLKSSSPSAWALSPGRTLVLPPSPSSASLTSSPSLQVRYVATTSNKGRSSSSSSLGSSVLRYFQRQKRPASSPEEEEGLHQYRVMSNRLLQWRFANAKSQASMHIIKKKSEEKLFAVWVKLCKMRNSIAEKRSRVQRLRLKVKLLQIVCPQIQLLDIWEGGIDKKNSEAVGRVARKLSAYSTKLPLVNGANLDIIDLYEVMRFALELMQDIEIHITDFLSRAEETYDILTQIIGTMAEHDKCFQELPEIIATIMALKAEEMSLRANVIQANREAWETQNSCKLHRFISAFQISSRGQIFNPLFSILNVS